jgi:hypothetical protein
MRSTIGLTNATRESPSAILAESDELCVPVFDTDFTLVIYLVAGVAAAFPGNLKLWQARMGEFTFRLISNHSRNLSTSDPQTEVVNMSADLTPDLGR